jgi:glycerate 2-kinase
MTPDLEAIYREALEELSGERLARAAVAACAGALQPDPGGRVRVLALGKAAAAMARGAAGLAWPLEGVAASASAGAVPDGVELALGAHPLPDARSLRAGEALLAAASRQRPSDRLLALVSGGGSAIAAAPAPGLTLDDERAASQALLRSGAPIDAMNAVRKHLSRLKGGLLGAACGQPRGLALILCDVPSGDLAAVASGPFCADPTTFDQALEAVRAYRVELDAAARLYLEAGARGEAPETLKPGDPRLAHLAPRLLASPPDLARAAARRARTRGTPCDCEERAFSGDLGELAARLLARALSGPPGMLAIAGEPALAIPPGVGSGGRMQHLALTLARALAGRRFRALCAGSDGRDGDTPHAGAVVDGETARRAQALGVDLDRVLARFDSAAACRSLGAALPAFDSGTNLCDLVLLSTEV